MRKLYQAIIATISNGFSKIVPDEHFYKREQIAKSSLFLTVLPQQKIITSKFKHSLMICFLLAAGFLLLGNNLKAQSYINVPVTGFNADVVADGNTSPTAQASTTDGIDGAGLGAMVFTTSSFYPSSLSAACATAATSFPATITSSNTTTATGITYVMQSATTKNALRLPVGSSGTLAFSNPVSASTLYIVCLGGNGASSFSATVTYTDNTTTVVNSLSAPDWCGGAATNKLPNATSPQIFYRIARSATACNATCQYMYEIPVTGLNTAKTIKSVTLANSTAGVFLHVFAIGAKTGSTLSACATPTAQPTNLTISSTGISNAIGGFTPASPSCDGYLVVSYPIGSATTDPTNGTTYNVGQSLGLGTVIQSSAANGFNATGLNMNGRYDFYVYSYNTMCTGGIKYLTTSPLTLSGITASQSCGTMGTSGYTTIKIGSTYSNTLSGNSSDGFTSLTQAINYLNTNGLSGNTVWELQSSYTTAYALANETYPLTFSNNQCLTSSSKLTIRPASTVSSQIVLTSNSVFQVPTIDFNGGSYITIDGRLGGTGGSATTSGNQSLSYLSITDTSANAAATIRFYNEASNNTLTYLDIQGQQTTYTAPPSSGVVLIGSTNGVSGNDNNTISYCNIHATSTGQPTTCIAAYNSTAGGDAANNDNNTITYNNLYDFFANVASNNATGIYVWSGNNSFNITNNSIYQTATRAYSTATTVVRGLWLNPNSSSAAVSYASGFTVTGNYIGGTAAQCGGTPFNFTASSTTRFIGIDLSFGNGTISNVNNNFIQNITYTTTSATSGASGTFTGIYLGYGYASIANNLIGGATANNIKVTPATSSAGSVSGIGIAGGAAGFTIPVTGNIINNITVASASASIVNSINGILVSATLPTFNIGGTTASLGNVISNLTAGSSISTGTTTTAIACGINFSGALAAAPLIQYNKVFNLFNYMPQVGSGTTASVQGILLSSTSISVNPTISNNTIYNLANNAAVATALAVSGITVNSGTATTTTISSNWIHSLNAPNSTVTANIPLITGINLTSGAANVYNNMVRLGLDTTGAAITKALSFAGIKKAIAQNANILFNSVYIGGTGVANNTSAANTYALFKTTSGTDVIEDNIFVNVRTNNAATTPAHFGVNLNNATGLTLNYNDYQTAATTGATTGNYFGFTGTANQNAWASGWVSGDVNSVTGDPQFNSATGAAVNTGTLNLDISSSSATVIEGQGLAMVNVTTDLHGNNRGSYTPTDIGASAGNFTSTLTTCSSLTGGTASATSFSCPGQTSTSLSLSGNTTGVAGLSYQWYSRTPAGSGSYTPIAGATLPTINVTVPSPSADYYCTITCSAGGTANSSTATLSIPGNLSLPYSQGFNTTPLSANCFSQQTVTGTSVTFTPTATTTYLASSGNSLTINPSEGSNFILASTTITANNQSRLVSPPLNVTGVSNVTLQYDWYQGTSSTLFNTGLKSNNFQNVGVDIFGYAPQIKVQYSTDGSQWTDANTNINNAYFDTGWVTQTVTLPSGANNQSTLYIGFLVTSPTVTASSTLPAAIDNVKFLAPCSGTPSAGTAVSYYPLVVTGFNKDVIANGKNGTTNNATNTTTASVDNVTGSGFTFFDQTYTYNGTYPLYSLPANGQVVSGVVTGLLYQLAPASKVGTSASTSLAASDTNNVLQLVGTNTSGYLNLQQDATSHYPSGTALYALAVTGSSSGSNPLPTLSAVVKFTDSTSQTFTKVVPDWYYNYPYSQRNFGRVGATASNPTTQSAAAYDGPRMYDITMNLQPSNYSKEIAYVKFTNVSTSASTSSNLINIFAMTIAESNTPLTFCGGLATSVTLFNPPVASGISYQWYSSSDNINFSTVTGGTGANTITYTNNSSTGLVYYQCKATCTGSGITANSNNVTVSINPVPTVTANSKITTCLGANATLTASTPASGVTTFNWTLLSGSGGTLSSSQGSSITDSATTSGQSIYTITANNGGCLAYANDTIIFNPILTSGITINPSTTTVCLGLPVNYSASGANYYSWSPSTYLSSSTSATPIATPTSAGTTTYTVTGTLSGGANTGCLAQVTASLTTNPILTSGITINNVTPSICAAQTDTLTASGINTYTWTPNTNLSSTTTATVYSSPTSTTTYTVQGTLSGGANAGCLAQGSTTVTVTGTAPTITSITASPASICNNGSSILSATASLPSGAAAYSFAQSNGTYTALSGATTIASGTGLDDNIYAPVNIGFTFSYLGNSFTTIGTSANGWAKLGATPSATSVRGAVLSSAADPNVLAPFAADLYGNTTNAKMSYLTTGSAPNRVFTMEWFNWGVFSTGSAEFNMQIKLYETSNLIQFVYQPITPSSTTSAAVGISGAATTDYNDRTTTTSWASITAGTANTSTCSYSSSIFPSDGLTFTWTPPVASGLTYTWSPATFLSSTSGASVNATNVNTTTTYTLTADNSGCAKTATVTVSVSPLSAIISPNLSGSYCSNFTNTLIGSGTGGSGAGTYTYSWSPSTGLYTDAAATIPYTGTSLSTVYLKTASSTTYTLTITDNCGTPATITYTPSISVSPASPGVPTASYAANSTTLTESSVAVSGTNNYWQSSLNGTSSADNANTPKNYTSTQKVYIRAQDATNGCWSTADSLSILVYVPITGRFSTTQPTCGTTTGTINIQDSGSGTVFNNKFNGTLPSQATASGNAGIVNGVLRLTDNANSAASGNGLHTGGQAGALVVTNSTGIASQDFQVDFDFITSGPAGVFYPPNTAADGFSYSYGDDVSTTFNNVGNSNTNIGYSSNTPIGNTAEGGSGTKLKMSFDPFDNGVGNGENYPGVYFMYNCTEYFNATHNATGITTADSLLGVLDFQPITWWRATGTQVATDTNKTHVSISMSSSGTATLTMTDISTSHITNSPYTHSYTLPAAYLSSDQSTWKHIFAARTGGNSEQHSIDNLTIHYKITEYQLVGTTTGATSWQSTPNFSNLVPDTYTVYVRYIQGSTGLMPTSLGTVTINPPPTFTSATSATVCSGSSLNYTATSGDASATFSWTRAVVTGISNTAVTGSTAVLTETLVNTTAAPINVTYAFLVSDPNSGCVSQNVVVTVNPLPTAIISGTTSVCQNSTASTITVTGSNGVSPYTFTYNINGGSNQTITTTSGNSATVNAPTNNAGVFVYNLINVQDASSTTCSNVLTGTATVTVIPSSAVGTASAPSSDVCIGSSTTLSLSSFTGIVQWQQLASGNTWTTVGTATTYTTPSLTVPTSYRAVVTSGTCSAVTSNTVALTISNPPTVSIGTAGSTTMCAASTVTITATPVNGGVNPTYDFWVNGVSVQNNSSAVLNTTTLPDNGTVTVYITAGSGCSTPVLSSNSITFHYATASNDAWTGNVNTNYSTAGNWCSGFVPTNGAITINSVSSGRYPVLSSSVSLSSLTLASGTTFGLGTGNLTITGSISGAGTFVGSATGGLNMNSSAANTITFRTTNSADTMLGTLTLTGSGAVTLGSGLGINTLLSLNNAAAVLNINNKHLTIKSTSLANTAEVGAVAHGATITGGKVTVERYIPKELRNYRDLGASVANAGGVFYNWQESGAAGTNVNNGFFITGAGALGSPYIPGNIFNTTSGLDNTTSGNPSLYTFNGTTWPAVTNTKTTLLNPFQGYRAIVRGARNFNMGTNPNMMPTATTVRASGTLVTGDVTMTTAGTTVTDNSSLNSSSIKLTTGSQAYSLIANPYACPVQWSKILGHSNIYNTYWYMDPTYQDPSTGYQRYITVQYTVASGLIVTPNPKAGGSFNDVTFDYIQAGQAIQVNNYGATGTPSISFREADKIVGGAHNDVFGLTTPSLMSIELYKNNTLADAAVASFNNNFTTAIGTEDAAKMMNSGENISITESNNDLSIDGLPTPSVNDVIPVRLGQLTANTTYQLKADVSNYTVAGLQGYVRDNMLNTEVPAGSMISFTPTSVDAQSYKDRFSIVFKQSKVVPIVTVKGNISVFPNPVTEKSFKVQTSNIATGKYTVVMVNNLGQEVMSTPITHVEGSNTETITMSKTLGSGVYTLVLKSVDGKAVYQSELLAK